jgi:hypothetical protein
MCDCLKYVVFCIIIMRLVSLGCFNMLIGGETAGLLETLVRILLQCTGKGMCHENLIVHVLRIYLYMFYQCFQ